ncbi:MAG: hypothetical protein M3347_12725, partial [Armatimonadota bacterium]|nr:hypothetical protein [Armatimonadota bacterium]
LDWNQVVDELAAMPPQRLSAFMKRLQKRRREITLRQGYTALAKMSFDDVPDADTWLTLENEALQLVEAEAVEEEAHAHP